MKVSSGNETCEVFVIPASCLSFQAHGIFAGRFSIQILGHVPERREVGRRVPAFYAAVIVAEHHVHDPTVQAIFPRPMVADHGAYNACK